MNSVNIIYNCDCIDGMQKIKAESVDMIMTSPPYWSLRDYEALSQIGREQDVGEYINRLCDVFDIAHTILKKEGTLWVNMGDVYGGTGDKGEYRDPKYPMGRNGQCKALNKASAKKCLLQVPSLFAIEMCKRGWILRNEIIWHKPNAMPSSVKDRFTVDFEKLFFFTKSQRYYFQQQLEPYKATPNHTPRDKANEKYKNTGLFSSGGRDYYSVGKRNMRSVWAINTKPYKEAHFASYPESLCEVPIRAVCPENGIVLDPFFGAGTTGLVALKMSKRFIGIELNKRYCYIAKERIEKSGFACIVDEAATARRHERFDKIFNEVTGKDENDEQENSERDSMQSA